MNEPIMVTGGTGFVGSYLAAALDGADFRVVAFDRFPPTPERQFAMGDALSRLEYVCGDVTCLPEIIEAVRRHEVHRIVHLATQQDLDFADAHPYETYSTNVTGSLNVLEATRLLGLGRTVIGSSAAALVIPQSIPVTESHPTFDPRAGHPTGHYGASKAAAEIIAMAYHAVYGSDVVLLRFPSIYGLGSPHRTHVGPAIEAAVRGDTVAFDSGGGAYRDYLYVKDVAGSIVTALTTPAERLSQRLFFVATGTLSSAADLARIIEEIYPGSRVIVGPGQTPLEARAAPIRVLYDVAQARLVLGFLPRYDLRAGVIDYATMLRGFLAQHPESRSRAGAISKGGGI